MAIEDFYQAAWSVVFTLDIESNEIGKPSFRFSESEYVLYRDIDEKHAPTWVRVMAMRLYPRVEAVLRGWITEPIRSYNNEVTPCVDF